MPSKSSKRLQIESRVIGDIGRNHIVPTAIIYQNTLLENTKNLKEICGSADILIVALGVANFIKSDHYEVTIDYQEALNSIEEIIYSIESYDITTVRASVGMYLLSKYIYY